MNDTSQWHALAESTLSHIHPSYPRDGRETINDEYEQAAPTNTVACYLAALERVREGDPSLPPDFAAYLAQRVPSSRLLPELDGETPIDRLGRLG